MKKEARRASLSALEAALVKCLAEPSAVGPYELLRDAAVSQGRLAAFTSGELGIVGSSLNTFKAAAEIYVVGGFKKLDELRKTLVGVQPAQRLTPADVPPLSKRERLQDRAAKAEGALQSSKEDLLLVLWVLKLSMRQGLKYAQESGVDSLLEKCRREQRDLLVMLECRIPRNPPADGVDER